MNTCVGQWTEKDWFAVKVWSISYTFFGYSCSNCSNALYGLPLFLFIEFVPIIVFYLIVLFFQVYLTSAPFTAFVIFSQIAVYSVTTVFGPYSFETRPVIYYFSLAIRHLEPRFLSLHHSSFLSVFQSEDHPCGTS